MKTTKIIQSYTITDKNTADGSIWYSLFKLYIDSLTIDSGFKDVLTLDYDELPLYLKSLKECNNTKDQVYMDSGKGCGIYLTYCSDNSIEVTLDDFSGMVGELREEEYDNYVSLLETIITLKCEGKNCEK